MTIVESWNLPGDGRRTPAEAGRGRLVPQQGPLAHVCEPNFSSTTSSRRITWLIRVPRARGAPWRTPCTGIGLSSQTRPASNMRSDRHLQYMCEHAYRQLTRIAIRRVARASSGSTMRRPLALPRNGRPVAGGLGCGGARYRDRPGRMTCGKGGSAVRPVLRGCVHGV